MDALEKKEIEVAADGSPHVIAGNVDLSTGNIDVAGPLVVRGDVMMGYTVRARGSLEVFGNVEDSAIDVDGDVTIHQGFTGSGRGRINATGNVRVLHVRGQSITAGKDVFIENECVNATIHAGGRIHGPRAVVSGGKLDAMTEIEMGELGLADDAPAKVRVGHRAKIIEGLGQLDKDLVNAERQLREVKEAVYKLVKIKVDGLALPAEKEALLAKLQAAQKLLPERIAAMSAERNELQIELQKKSTARLVVHGTVQADTMIEINGARKILDAAVRSAEFVEWGGALEARSL
jgi:uncharacterized protein (DUF342 family)